MADPKVPARIVPQLPSLLSDVMSSDHLPAGNHWFGLERDVIANNQRVVDNSAAYNTSRARQTDSYIELLRARMRAAHVCSEIADLPNALGNAQREREHSRSLAEDRRVLERLAAVHELKMALARHDTELAQQREKAVRADRNRITAETVKDEQIQQWYHEQQARANEARATYQDTAHDLNRAPASDQPRTADAQDLEQLLATLDDQLAKEKARNNSQAVMALQNLRARIKSAA